MRKFGKQLLAGPYLVWIIGFIILPVFAVLYYALTNSAGSFTMENIAAIAEPVHLKALFLALKLAVICTLICLLLSYPLAMILNNMKIKEHSFVVFLFVLPMWMNFMLRILAWQMLLSNNGIINSLLKTLGFSGINLMNTPTAVVFGMVYDYLPFMILPIYNALVRIRKDLIEAARDLGAGNLLVFFKIILPQVIKQILPSVTNEVITLVKDTSLAFTLSVVEMFSMAKALAASQTSMIPFVAAGIFYYIFNLIVAVGMEWIEKKLAYYR